MSSLKASSILTSSWPPYASVLSPSRGCEDGHRVDWGRGWGGACILGAGTDTAGGRQELGWRAAIVRPGTGGEGKGGCWGARGGVQTETEDGSAAFGAATKANCWNHHRCAAFLLNPWWLKASYVSSASPEVCFSTFKETSAPLQMKECRKPTWQQLCRHAGQTLGDTLSTVK